MSIHTNERTRRRNRLAAFFVDGKPENVRMLALLHERMRLERTFGFDNRTLWAEKFIV